MPGAMGIVGDIMGGVTKGHQVGGLEEAQKKFANLSPEQLSAMVTKATAPLSEGLVQTVGNRVQADMAGRGLAEAPGIFAATESQALAPYELEQRQMALQLVMKQLGLPIEYANAVLSALNSGTGGGGAGNMDILSLLPLLGGA